MVSVYTVRTTLKSIVTHLLDNATQQQHMNVTYELSVLYTIIRPANYHMTQYTVTQNLFVSLYT